MVNKLARLLPLLLIITAAPAVSAAIKKNQQVQIAENPPAEKPTESNPNEIQITPAQKAKMDQIVSSSVAQIKNVLTPAQVQRINGGEKLTSLKLTSAQQAKIRAIQESNEQQLLSILTPEQRAKIKARK